MDGRIIVLIERISRNLQKKWTIKNLAGSLGLSESHLQMLFKQETGISPIKYIRHLRLEKAKELLEDRRFWRIQEICNQIGINDQSHFAREFKKRYGTTPAQYRKNFWNNYNAKNEIS